MATDDWLRLILSPAWRALYWLAGFHVNQWTKVSTPSFYLVVSVLFLCFFIIREADKGFFYVVETGCCVDGEQTTFLLGASINGDEVIGYLFVLYLSTRVWGWAVKRGCWYFSWKYLIDDNLLRGHRRVSRYIRPLVVQFPTLSAVMVSLVHCKQVEHQIFLSFPKLLIWCLIYSRPWFVNNHKLMILKP